MNFARRHRSYRHLVVVRRFYRSAPFIVRIIIAFFKRRHDVRWTLYTFNALWFYSICIWTIDFMIYRLFFITIHHLSKSHRLSFLMDCIELLCIVWSNLMLAPWKWNNNDNNLYGYWDVTNKQLFLLLSTMYYYGLNEWINGSVKYWDFCLIISN